MTIRPEFICGCLFGVEVVPEYRCAMIDIAFLRIFIDWGSEEDE